ncbi:MAG: M16 family metallopeptidase [Pyrinomonadaceae bacterium]
MKPQIQLYQRVFRRIIFFAASMAALLSGLPPCARAAAQGTPEPRREQLLNGLKVLLLHRPGDPEVLLKLRIHSGAAFDLTGKDGMTALLGDALFSDPSTRMYVTEDLGGRLEVTTDYDAINVTLAGRVAEFERLVELLRNALVNTPLSAEVVGRLREARVKAVREVSVAPSAIADRAISSRLFGAYPYGRVVAGTPETLARVDRADLMLARERFLNPNNATLAVVGGAEPSRALRALRQFLGVWRKSDRDVPATFRQPEAPDARTLIVGLAGAPDAEVRLAVRGLARTDRDAAAADVLAVVARERWLKSFPELKGRPFYVVHGAYALPGVFRVGASVPSAQAAGALETGRAVLQSLVTTAPSAAEFETAKAEVAAGRNARSTGTEGMMNAWLVAEAYGINGADEIRAVSNLTPGDVQRVAARLFRSAAVAAVAVGDAAQLRAELAKAGAVEVLGDPAPEAKASPASPAQAPPLQMKRP